jgi:hypothetical protein
MQEIFRGMGMGSLRARALQLVLESGPPMVGSCLLVRGSRGLRQLLALWAVCQWGAMQVSAGSTVFMCVYWEGRTTGVHCGQVDVLG